MNTTRPRKPPRAQGYWFALGGFLLGSVESVAFNVLAAFISPTGYTFANWLPNLPSLAGAAVWPIALLVSVEVLARVEWETGWGWWLVRVGGIVAVAASSAVISYFHIHDVLVYWKYGALQAFVGPFVIDGQMLISGFALYAIGRASRAALTASQDAAAEAPATPSRTLDVPAHAAPTAGQEHTVPVTSSTPENVTGTAPKEAPEPVPSGASSQPPGDGRSLRLVDTRRVRRTSSRGTSRKTSCSDEDVLVAIASYETDHQSLPSANWLKTNLQGVGHERAKDLLETYRTEKQEALA